MIQAWFRTSESAVIPAFVPDGDLLDLAQTLGIEERELFRIELPSGATRPGRVRVLVKQSQLATLYASQSDGSNPSAEFRWQEYTTVSPQSMDVWLLPPKPLFMVAGAEGIAVVEAVDARWWWGQSQANTFNTTPIKGDLFSSDGRWQSALAESGSLTPRDMVIALQGAIATAGLPSTFSIPAGYNPPATLLNRVADHLMTPECSLAMAIDLVLAGTGWMMQWDTTTSGLTLAPVGDDVLALDAWMKNNERAYVGGLAAPGGGTTPSEPLMSLWYGQAAWARNLMPNAATVMFPYRSTESLTIYANSVPRTQDLRFAVDSSFGWEASVTSGRPRADIGKRLLKEPRPLVASNVQPPTSGFGVYGTTSPSWDYAAYRTQVINNLQTRATVMTGKTGWAGWPALPLGSYRCTMLCYTLARRNGEIVPLAITDCDTTDWLLGPDGMMPTDPKDIVLSKGLAHAYRTWSGLKIIDAAPPNTRAFLARITGAAEICPNPSFPSWKWLYDFEEVEPNLELCPFEKEVEYRREGVARNMIESTNNPAAGYIAPGVSATNYPGATVYPEPIQEGTLVHMIEQFNVNEGPSGYGAPTSNFWFVLPNAITVICP